MIPSYPRIIGTHRYRKLRPVALFLILFWLLVGYALMGCGTC